MIALSIVIPAYNEAAFIGTLLERIAAVDLAALDVSREIIVVDDGSRDRTNERASAIAPICGSLNTSEATRLTSAACRTWSSRIAA